MHSHSHITNNMVSKILKRTPTKCLKDGRSRRHHHHHRKRSPSPATSSTVLASINKSLSSCRRRLVKIFSKLARISTPTSRRRGYKILKKPEKQETPSSDPSTARRTLFFDDAAAAGIRLPPPLSPHKKTVFLDLDETLVHSKADPPPQHFDFVVRPVIDGEAMNFYVLKRPGVHEFLDALAKRYEVVVFTAGLKEYASLVIDRIDRSGAISHRLYRDSCREMDGKLVKDLAGLGRDLNWVTIVDDNPNSYMLQPENAIPVRPFVDDSGDRELGKLIRFFEHSVSFDNMRDAVKLYRAEIECSSDQQF